MDQAYSEIQPLLGLVLIRWRMIMGSQIMDQGLAVLYRSKDFVHWVKVENPPTLSAKLECGSVRIFFGYTIGTYNVTTDKYIPEEGSMKGVSGLRYDYGQFYASKTFFDSAKNRRILWGWINESCIQFVASMWSSLDNDNDKTTNGTFLNVDPVHEKLSRGSLINHSTVESFGVGGKACITARVYPILATDDRAQRYAFNYGN
ncbi:hypothetical protein WN944_021722 [Citrus x changshan-huyou]|uniref:Beta-fructofuranosidase n=1 Tax=Citrus x changshan-huyou TaxID=2935761 RepID=A0AAP0R2U5_9ROSI